MIAQKKLFEKKVLLRREYNKEHEFGCFTHFFHVCGILSIQRSTVKPVLAKTSHDLFCQVEICHKENMVYLIVPLNLETHELQGVSKLVKTNKGDEPFPLALEY